MTMEQHPKIWPVEMSCHSLQPMLISSALKAEIEPKEVLHLTTCSSAFAVGDLIKQQSTGTTNHQPSHSYG